jgi:hypothetical protein
MSYKSLLKVKEDTLTLEVSDSSINLFNSCPRAFEFRKIFNSVRQETTLPTGLGKALHEASQEYVVSGDRNKSIFQLLLHYPYQFYKNPLDNRSWQSAINVADTAFNFWDAEMKDWEIVYLKHPKTGELVPACEVPFGLKLKGLNFQYKGKKINIRYIGYIDLILYNKKLDKYAVADIKTTASNADKTYEFRFASQCIPYALVLDTLLGKTNSAKDGLQILYWVQYIHFLDSESTLYPFTKTPQDITDWTIGFLDSLEHIFKYLNREHFPRRAAKCFTYNSPCKFFDICGQRDPQEIYMQVAYENAIQNKLENIREEPWIDIDLQIDTSGVYLNA